MSAEDNYDSGAPAGDVTMDRGYSREPERERGGYSGDRDPRDGDRAYDDREREREPMREAPPPPRSYGGGGRANQPKPDPSPCLGVFGLSLRTRESDLEVEFGRYGDVQSVTIVYDQKTGRSRCFGFIQMGTTDEAAMCIEKLNGFDLHGRNMRVDFSTTQKPHDPTPGAYMGHKRSEPPRGSYGGGYGGYSRGGFYEDRRGGGRYDDRSYDRRGGGRDDYYDRRGRDDRYDYYNRYDSSYYRYDDSRDRDYRDRYDRRDRSPARRRDYYDSDAAPSRSRRYSRSPDPRDDRRDDRERDPRSASGRAAYDDVAPVANDRY